MIGDLDDDWPRFITRTGPNFDPARALALWRAVRRERRAEAFRRYLRRVELLLDSPLEAYP